MTDNEIIHDECCTDCLMLIANDDTSGTERCQTEQGDRDYRAEVASRTKGYHWFPSSWPGIDWTEDDRYYGRDTEPAFRWSGCSFCGSPLGGDRHPVSGFTL